MIVHFQASAEKIKNDIATLRHIVDIVHSEGHSLAVDWIEPAYARTQKKGTLAAVDWKAIYKENIAATTRADVIIVEATLRSFGTGYLLARAVALKKPTLILRRDNAENDNMVIGIDERTVSLKTYNERTLEKIVEAFLKENEVHTKDLRFNFYISRRIENYLLWASVQTGEKKLRLCGG